MAGVPVVLPMTAYGQQRGVGERVWLDGTSGMSEGISFLEALAGWGVGVGIGDEAQKESRSGLEKQSLLFGGGMTWRFWFTWLRALRWGEETGNWQVVRAGRDF